MMTSFQYIILLVALIVLIAAYLINGSRIRLALALIFLITSLVLLGENLIVIGKVVIYIICIHGALAKIVAVLFILLYVFHHISIYNYKQISGIISGLAFVYVAFDEIVKALTLLRKIL